MDFPRPSQLWAQGKPEALSVAKGGASAAAAPKAKKAMKPMKAPMKKAA